MQRGVALNTSLEYDQKATRCQLHTAAKLVESAGINSIPISSKQSGKTEKLDLASSFIDVCRPEYY